MEEVTKNQEHNLWMAPHVRWKVAKKVELMCGGKSGIEFTQHSSFATTSAAIDVVGFALLLWKTRENPGCVVRLPAQAQAKSLTV